MTSSLRARVARLERITGREDARAIRAAVEAPAASFDPMRVGAIGRYCRAFVLEARDAVQGDPNAIITCDFGDDLLREEV